MRLLVLLCACAPFWLPGQSSALADSAYARAEQDDYAGAGKLLLRAAEAERNAYQAAIYQMEAGDAFRYADSLRVAVAAYQKLQDYPSTDERVDSLRALAFHLSGVVLGNNGRDADALPYYYEAIALRDRLFPGGHNDRAKSRLNVGITMANLGRLSDAERYLSESDDHYASLPAPDSMRWLNALHELARVYTARDDRQLSLSVVRRARPIFEQYYALDTARLAYNYLRFGSSLVGIEADGMALVLLDSARQHYQEIADERGVKHSRLDYAAALLETDDLLTAARVAEELTADFSTDTSAFADNLLPFAAYNAALARLRIQDWRSAIHNGRISLDAFLAQGDSSQAVAVQQLIARAHSESGKYAAAERGFARTVSLLYPSGQLPRVSEIPADQLVTLGQFLDDRARHRLRNGDDEGAKFDLDQALAIMDRIRTEQFSEESQRWVTAYARPLFQIAIGIRYDLYRQRGDTTAAWQALTLAERAKAFSLLSSYQRRRSERPRRERNLRRQIARLERSQDRSSELARLQLELDRLEKRSEAEVPAPPGLNPQQLRQYLTREQTHLLTYALGDERSYRFFATPRGALTIELLPGRDTLAVAVGRFRATLAASAYKKVSLRPDQAKRDAAWLASNDSLSRWLIPVRLWQENNPNEKLVVIPDGELGFLPFGTLLPTEKLSLPLAYAELPYLQNDRSLSYAYSAAHLLALAEEAPARQSRNLLGFAPAFRGEATVAAVRAVVVEESTTERSFPALLPLRYNDDEVQTVADLIPWSAASLGPSATRIDFERRAPNYRILLVSSHALVDAQDPNRSFIAFTQRGDSLETDEMLYLNDLEALRLPNELAVLSACETSLGQVARGEGILSLSRAFAAAGAASTLTTLWKVDDEATKLFTVEFFRQLAAGQSRAGAVAAAQASALAEGTFAHPRYWAAMTLYGRPGPVELRPAFAFNRASWLTLAGVGSLLLLSLGLFIRNKRA